MKFQLQATAATRANLKKIMQPFSIEQLNAIPKGFHNNLLWNAGHVVVTQQLLCYGLSGLEMNVPKEMIAKYRKGSAPVSFIGEEEYQMILESMDSTMATIEKDLEKGLFQSYKEYPTSYGVTLSSIEDAVQFNLAHEALHMGSMLALKKLV